MDDNGVIVFENLRQRSNVVGEYDEVKAKVKPFVASNAKGLLRDVHDHNEVKTLAIEAAERTKILMASC